MASVTIIYASTSGHTEYVVQHVAEEVRSAKCEVRIIRVELAKPEDLTGSDFLILASSTWNTGGIEGQLNPHMHEFLLGRAKDANFDGKKVFLIALGDDRYRYTAQAGKHLRHFVTTHGGIVVEPELTIVNEPYGQENKISDWVKTLIVLMKDIGHGTLEPQEAPTSKVPACPAGRQSPKFPS